MKIEIKFIGVVFALIALLCAGNSFAVDVKDCPKTVQIKISDFKVVSAEELNQRLSGQEKEDSGYENVRGFLSKQSSIELTLTLTNAFSARCSYKLKSNFQETNGGEAVFASSGGKDWIRLELETPAGIVGGYLTVTKYSTKEIEFSQKTSLGYDAQYPTHPGFIDPAVAVASRVQGNYKKD